MTKYTPPERPFACFQSLLTDPVVTRFALDLGSTQAAALGHVVRLGIFVAVHRPDGDLSGLDETDIASAAGYELLPVDPDNMAQNGYLPNHRVFVASMVSAGLIGFREDGTSIVPETSPIFPRSSVS